jgi:predicted membrane protein
VTGRLVLPFFILQLGLGSAVPLIALTTMILRGTKGRALIIGVTASAALVLCAVLLMRWNVVIGGQEISKTGRGLVTYEPELFGREGLLAAGMVLVMPMILMFLATRIFSPWAEESRPALLRGRAPA